MNNINNVEVIEQNIKQAKVVLEFGTALDKLRNNRDFKKVVIEGYFEQEAIRLVHLKSDPAMQTPTMQASIISQMDSIGALAQFFQVVEQRAAMALRVITDDEETLNEIYGEAA